MPSWRCTQNLKTLAPIGAEKSVTEISIGEKEKWTNKGTDKQYVAVLLLHNTTHHFQVVPNFRILTQRVAEKSLTEKNVYIYYIRVKEEKKEKMKKEAKWGLAS